MKKNFLSLSVAAALLAAAGTASAAVGNTGYIGVQAGYVNADWDTPSAGDIYQSNNTDGFAPGIYAGYNFTPWFGLEGGYKHINGIKAQRVGTTEYKDVNVHGPELAVRFAFPLNETGADIFLRGGGMYAMGSGSDSKFAPLVGVGVSVDLSPSLDVRVGYDRYFDVYDNKEDTTGIGFDMDMAYIGLNYVWGRSAPAAAPAEAPKVEETVTNTVTNTYTLDANTLFTFDSSKVSPEGKDAVAQVVTAANESKLADAQYVVTGHTDRIGRAAYNQKLSEQRAKAVADELVALGVPAQAIVSNGVGSSEPVTGTECDGLSRNELIKCLSPDRRVVVNVTGSNTTTETTTVVK